MNAPVNQQATKKPFSWSYSALKNFRTCQLRHQQVDRIKAFKEEESEQLKWGNTLHAAMAKAVQTGADLPIVMRHFKPYVETARSRLASGWDVSTELKLAFSRQLGPTSYFDNTTWFRGVVDVLMLKPPVAMMWDWKTGKVIEDLIQLGLFAQMVFCHHPELEQVDTAYVWLGNDAISHESWTRDRLAKVWADVLPDVKRMEEAYNTGVYHAMPGGLCKRYCPVESCQYHGIGSY